MKKHRRCEICRKITNNNPDDDDWIYTVGGVVHKQCRYFNPL